MKLPLSGLVVLDFGHTVMGPSCGLVLADLGADVIHVEPPAGDPTRFLKGFGTGYFGFFNRNKRSIGIDLKSAQGIEVARRLVSQADVLIENFAPGAMARLGLGYEDAARLNPRLVYVSLKGFLSGPYDQRMALDEVVQMMSGLAFMTGPNGRPLRAGSSVVDISGGLFGTIGALVGLRQRDQTGKGMLVDAALFETAVFLMGQHLSYAAQSDEPLSPMPHRVSAWAIYDLFDVKGGEKLFVGITSDAHWTRFCEVGHWPELKSDPTLATNNLRIAARPRLVPILKGLLGEMTLLEAEALCEAARIPFARVARPEDLLSDPHLQQSGGLLEMHLPGGIEARLPGLPMTLDSQRFGVRSDPPAIGEHSVEVLRDFGFNDTAIAQLLCDGVVAGPAASESSAAAQ